LALELQINESANTSDEEGVAAFMEKRAPDFKGK
jgi:1,4-dihydroxy-2-naphthoyl-CoA synthase